MGLTAIYDATFSLAVVLLSLVVPVFVFSVSLLGLAIESTRKEREQAEKQKQKELEEKIEEAKAELDEAKESTDVSCIKRLSTEIGRLQKENKRVLKQIERTSTALTVRGAVLWPGLAFLVALGLAGASRALTHTYLVQSVLSWGFIAWFLALGALTIGLVLFWKTLVVVQLVAIRSEETAHRKMVIAFKQAQRELDTERRPELTFKWREEHPFRLQPGEEKALRYTLELTKGDSAEQAEVWFFVDEELEFPGRERWALNGTSDIPGLTTTVEKYQGTLIPGMIYSRVLKIKASEHKGQFPLFVQCQCIGFLTPPRERFKIIVEEDDLPF